MTVPLLDAQTMLQQHVLGLANATPLVDGNRAHATQRLGIYVNAYRLRLAETLADCYEKTRQALGSERFERIASRFVAAHVPTTRSLRWYGAELPQALERWLPDEPGIAEIARLDWALRSAFDGTDAAPLAAADLAAVAPEAWATLGLRLHPTAQLLDFAHNSVAVWQAFDDDEAPPALERGTQPVPWLVWRKGLQPHFRSLHPIEAALLQALLAGDSFAVACTRAEAAVSAEGAEPPEAQVAAHIGWSLRQWLEDELLVGLVEGD